jgi:hypothetical protein
VFLILFSCILWVNPFWLFGGKVTPDKAQLITPSSRRLLLAGIFVNLILFPLNHVVGIAVNRGDYTPFSVDPRASEQVYDETQLYTPGPSRLFHAGRLQAELDVRELRGESNAYPVLHSILLGLLAKIMHSLEWTWMVSHALFPTLIWVILFWFGWQVLGSAVAAMAVAWGTCLFAFGPRNLLLLGWARFIQPLELTRIPQPGISFLFLLLSVVLLASAIARPAGIHILLAGITAGTLFYAYYFYWIAFFTGAGVLWVALILLRHWKSAKTVFMVAAAGCLAGIPFFFWTIQGMRSGHQQDLMRRVGAFTRTPDLKGLILAALLLLVLWIYCKIRVHENSDYNTLFQAVLLAVIAGSALGLNFHLLTGYNAQHPHFYNRALQPLGMYATALLVLGQKPIREKLNTRAVVALASLVIFSLLSLATLRQVQAGRVTASLEHQSSPNIDVLTWLRSHAPAGLVLGSTDRDLLSLIPGIAGTWTFVPLGDRSMASTPEILTRYLMLSRLEGKTWSNVERELRADEGFRSGASSLSYALVMERRIEPHEMETARSIWEHLDLGRDFRGRQLDYLITRSNLQSATVPRALGSIQLVYQNPIWHVLKFNTATAGS